MLFFHTHALQPAPPSKEAWSPCIAPVMNRFQILQRFSKPLSSANWSLSRCSSSSSPNNENLLSMKDIPGPRGLPILGSTLDYLRVLEKTHLLLFERAKKYGNIYKEKIFAGMPYSVVVTDASDIETVFRADGKYPIRPDTPISYDMRDALKIPYGLLFRYAHSKFKNTSSFIEHTFTYSTIVFVGISLS